MGHEDFGVDLSWTCVPRSVGHLFIDVFKQREQLGFLFVKRCRVKESPRMVHRHATSEGIMFQLRMSVHYLNTEGVELLNQDCGHRSSVVNTQAATTSSSYPRRAKDFIFNETGSVTSSSNIRASMFSLMLPMKYFQGGHDRGNHTS